jgi:hypothetical protein
MNYPSLLRGFLFTCPSGTWENIQEMAAGQQVEARKRSQGQEKAFEPESHTRGKCPGASAKKKRHWQNR